MIVDREALREYDERHAARTKAARAIVKAEMDASPWCQRHAAEHAAARTAKQQKDTWLVRKKNITAILASTDTPFLVGRVGTFGESYITKSGSFTPFPVRKQWSVQPCPITIDHGAELLGHTNLNAGLYLRSSCFTFMLCLDTPELMERVEDILPRIKGASIGWNEWQNGKCIPTHVTVMVDGTPKHKTTRVELACGLANAHKQLLELEQDLTSKGARVASLQKRASSGPTWTPSPDALICSTPPSVERRNGLVVRSAGEAVQ